MFPWNCKTWNCKRKCYWKLLNNRNVKKPATKDKMLTDKWTSSWRHLEIWYAAYDKDIRESKACRAGERLWTGRLECSDLCREPDQRLSRDHDLALFGMCRRDIWHLWRVIGLKNETWKLIKRVVYNELSWVITLFNIPRAQTVVQQNRFHSAFVLNLFVVWRHIHQLICNSIAAHIIAGYQLCESLLRLLIDARRLRVAFAIREIPRSTWWDLVVSRLRFFSLAFDDLFRLFNCALFNCRRFRYSRQWLTLKSLYIIKNC